MSKILFVLTSHETLGDTGRKTGFYLPEIAHPYAVFTAAGHDLAAVSPRGGTPPMDGADPGDPIQQAFLEDPTAVALIRNTLRPDQVDPTDYDAVFYVGGHGTMWDFPDNAELARTGAAVYEAGGVVGAVCHGPAGLVNLTLADGTYLVAGKDIAAFSNEEEAAVGLTDVVPFPLETTLIERGGRHTKAPAFQAHVVADGRLVTGQNPASATGVAERMVGALAAVSAAAA